MALFRDDVDYLPLLLPKPLADALKQGGFARAAVAERGKVAIGVFVVIIQVDEYRGAVVEVQAKEDTLLIAQLKGGKRKRGSHTGGQGVPAAFSLNVRV